MAVRSTAILAAATVLVAALSLACLAAAADELGDFIAAVGGADPTARANAWNTAANFGASAVPQLSELLGHENPEIAESALRALDRIVFHAGRPGSTDGAGVAAALAQQLQTPNTPFARREILYLLSLIATDAEIPAIVALLADESVGDDARMTLQRIPGDVASKALISALAVARGTTRLRIVDALAARGAVDAIPAIRELTKQRDAELQWTVLDALSRLGVAPGQVTDLSPSFTSSENVIFSVAYLRAGFAALDRGDNDQAARVFAGAAAHYYYPYHAGAALVGLEASGAPQFLRQALGFIDEPGIRPVAMRLLAETQLPNVDQQLLQAYNVGGIALKTSIFELLIRRNVDGVNDLVRTALESGEPELRYVAAVNAGTQPSAADLHHVATQGTVWRRHDAAARYLAFANATRDAGELERARALYESITSSPLSMTTRIAALQQLETMANPASLPAIMALKDKLFEARHIRENYTENRSQRVELELRDIGSEESSRAIVRSPGDRPQAPTIDPAVAAVASNEAFETAVNRVYLTLLAAKGDTIAIQSFAATSESIELLELIAELLEPKP